MFDLFDINVVENEIVMDEVEKPTALQSYNNIPKHVRMEVGKYALAHSTKGALVLQNIIQK